jgi:aldehyde dehydrogenase (NAD+)
VEKAIDFINAREKPLALYYFGNRNCRKVELETSSGALVHNDTVMYMMNLDLPFGGVGNSGYGCMHGKTGFDNCSHLKAFMEVRTFNFGPFLLRYPPFGETKCNRFKTVMNLLNVG